MLRRKIALLVLGLAIVGLNAGADCEADIDLDDKVLLEPASVPVFPADFAG